MMRKKNRIGAIVPDVNCEVRSQLAMVSIAHTLYAQLNWSQYKLLISIDDAQEREYYQLEAVNHCWTKRELERQIHSQLWERLCLSNDKEAVLAVARKERIPETPQEIISGLLASIRKATTERREYGKSPKSRGSRRVCEGEMV